MDNLGDGLERGFDENDDEQKQITKVKEGLYPSGLYFKEEDGSQGIAPRSQDSNAFKLSDEEMILPVLFGLNILKNLKK